MKKILLYLFFSLNFSYFCISQDENLRKAEAIQIAYLTKELGLTPQEAEKFWPVFNSYKAEVRQARIENRGDVVSSNEKVVKIQKRYQDEFKKVFSDDKKVGKVFKADQDFRDMLRKELESRNKNMGGGKEQKIKGKKNL